MPATRSPTTELDIIRAQSADALERATFALLRARIEGDSEGVERAERRLALALGRVMVLADLLGRRRLVLELRPFASFAADPAKGVTRVPFMQAVRNLLSRTPELAPGYRRVQRAYLERHAFALAKSASVTLTRRVAQVVSMMMAEGEPADRTTAVIARMGKWTRAYADNVYETNAATAYTAGRMDQAATLQREGVLLGFEFLARGGASGDGDNRPNHLAAHGLIAGVNDPVWDRFSPPLGYRCRCALSVVPEVELRRRNLITSSGEILTLISPGFRNAAPDKGFDRGIGSRRPDRMVYGLG